MGEIARRRAIPATVADVLPAIAKAGDTFVPLDALRTAISQFGAALGFRASHDIDAPTLRENAMVTCAVVPTLICALWRLREGLEPIAAARRSRLRGELPLHDAGRGPDAPNMQRASRST